MSRTGTQAIEAKRRRQWITLATLTITAIALIGIRMLGESPAPVTASNGFTETVRVAAASSDTVQHIDVTWPVQLQRDLFAWETVFDLAPAEAQVQPPVETGPDPAAIRLEATRSLKVTGIIMSEPAKALINGKLRLQGQTVDGFIIMRIDPRRVVVQKSGVEVAIEL